MVSFIPLTSAGQQTTAANPSSQNVANATKDAIPPGTLIQAEIMTDVDAKKAHPGDAFRVRLWADIRKGNTIILPQKTILIGHVVAAQPYSKDNPESTLTIAFDKALLKSGGEIPVHGVVERVQLSPMAASTAALASPSYKPGLNPGNTTNIAMPAAGSADQIDLTSGPTNVRDVSIKLQPGPSAGVTVLTSVAKSGLKLKRHATLDLRVTHSGE
ncbi:MAG TPA: hypothetical protein VFB79_11195 [Candidatus Angelobacter sp.]|nr:hypothetical protein [Candidatus Angelobacter sp.]